MSILKDFGQERLSHGADESLIDVCKVNDRKKSKKNLERQDQLILLHSEEIALLNDITEDQYLEEYRTAQTAQAQTMKQ